MDLLAFQHTNSVIITFIKYIYIYNYNNLLNILTRIVKKLTLKTIKKIKPSYLEVCYRNNLNLYNLIN